MRQQFVIADVFTRTAFGGNQLAVFPDARGLSDQAMQALAREFNFAESTFVLPPREPGHTHRVRIFTPRAELPFAGHPTIGTAAVLAQRNPTQPPTGASRLVFEEGVGPVVVDVTVRDGEVTSRFTLERGSETFATRPAVSAAAAALSLPIEAVINAWFASAGLPFCFIRLDSRGSVDRAAVDRAMWTAHFARAWSPNLFLFAGDMRSGSELYARMFAPGLGVEEDPATGSACAALAGCLAEGVPQRDGSAEWRIAQGVAMGRPSLIEASAEKHGGRVVRIQIAGATVIVGEGTMAVPQGL